MNSKEVKNIVMEFWNENIPGREETQIKSRKTVMKAVLDLDLVGKVIAVEREGKLYLINKTFMENGDGVTTK